MTSQISFDNLKSFLDEKVEMYNTPSFIETDPLSIPHRYTKKEDIEIAGFLAAILAWGNRKSIIASANKIMNLMDDDPYNFVMQHKVQDLKSFNHFVHRTFNGIDLIYFVQALKHIYQNHGGIEKVFSKGLQQHGDMQVSISQFKECFFEISHPERTKKHLPDPEKGSAAKRLNMYLRWMIRRDNRGVDFGIWDSILPSALSIPLDVHTGNTSRKLGMLRRSQNDHKAVKELDIFLRRLDPLDPVQYDFALFGLGAIENF